MPYVLIAKVVGALGILAALGFLADSVHFEPIRDLKAQVTARDEVISAYEKEFNKLYSKLYSCESNATLQEVQGFINGIGENNETYSTDLNNIST